MQPEITDSVISWLAVLDPLLDPLPTQYQVEFLGGHCGTREMVSVNDTSLVLSNLQSITASERIQLDRGANYTVQVRAVNPFANGEWSENTQLHIEISSK